MRCLLVTVLMVALLAPGCASSKTADLLEPEIRIAQMPGTSFPMRYAGRLTIRYALEITNVSSETIELQRVQLRVIGEGPYEVQSRAVPIRKAIAPDSSEVVEFNATAYSYGGLMAANEPVTLRGIAYFDSPEGTFRTIFTQVVVQPDDSAPR